METIKKFKLGLDIGTNSVGYALLDENNKVVRKNGHSFWGVRMFDESSDAKSRRNYRSNRRRLQRRKQRIVLLQELFNEEIKKVDKKCELFYAYLLKSLGDNKLLNKNIRKYALNKEQVRSISTLKNLLNKENKQVDEGIPFIMRLFLVLLLIISLILISYFVYLFWRKYS